MSDTTDWGHGLFITRYAGPASEGDDRARWQLTIPDKGYVQLTRAELRRLGTDLHALSLVRPPRPRSVSNVQAATVVALSCGCQAIGPIDAKVGDYTRCPTHSKIVSYSPETGDPIFDRDVQILGLPGGRR